MKIREVYESESHINLLLCNEIEDENFINGDFVVQSKISKHSGAMELLRSMFLPAGYPDSVTSDYMSYQVWDTAQALSSSLSGVLATRAMLRGYGVGNAAASVGSAVLQWILRDGAGMIGRIYFAWKTGRQLDCNAKTWRFMADILNDIGMTLEMLSPLSNVLFMPLSVCGIVSKSICGVAGGCTKASLTMHFAKNDNMGDVSAKDGSQETAVGLVGMFLGAALSASIPDESEQTTTATVAIWMLFFILIAFHLYCNYRAVTGVVLTSINRYRATLIYKHYLQYGEIPTPIQVSKRENILFRDDKQPIYLGASLLNIINLNKQQQQQQQSKEIRESKTNSIIRHKLENRYIDIWQFQQEIYISLKVHCTAVDLIQAYLYSVAILHQTKQQNNRAFIDLVTSKSFNDRLLSKGWNTDRQALDAEGWRYSIIN
ncbi:DUF647 family protein [Heterostelium album PN500]|uniref:DUF647 family protein n=1 Tax=Heterostelium pallidum (strain ATCC 26659 / Pp 5 / PN500) TaxID=670386 RepID=D3BQX5_HETP5|nr:DUF647 family protein [Heterostelium album PN500]EFA76161.1 DUF647 family protein [Heterostelium album PN500]|eukprot:XP_020428295.1 DUF647 family protein [Heterostelium album PN500]